MVQRSADDPSLVQVLLDQQSLMLEHGERTRQEAKAEKAEMNAKIDQLREELKSSPPTPALSNEQLSGLQLRLQALHAPKLLTDEQFIRLEDLCADYIELADAQVSGRGHAGDGEDGCERQRAAEASWAVGEHGRGCEFRAAAGDSEVLCAMMRTGPRRRSIRGRMRRHGRYNEI